MDHNSIQDYSDKILIYCIYYSFYIPKKDLSKYNLSETDKKTIIIQDNLRKLNKRCSENDVKYVASNVKRTPFGISS